jgi:hypothetical protein
MSTPVLVRSEIINVELKPHAIKIWNDDALPGLLKVDAESSTEELIENIKREYFKLFNIEFKVSNASIAIEIWAHVYAEKFADAVKDFSSVKFIDGIADKILRHAEVIDIGETGHDDNRFVWDGLAGFKSVIAGLLFS